MGNEHDYLSSLSKSQLRNMIRKAESDLKNQTADSDDLLNCHLEALKEELGKR